MPYTPIDANRNRLKASAAPSHFTVRPQKDLCLRIYTLDLTDDGSPDYSKRYVRLAPPEKDAFILRFKLVAGMLSSNNGVLYTNYPITSEPFDRKKFHPVRFSSDFSKDAICDVTVTTSGAYEYYVEYDSFDHPDSDSVKKRSERSGYFVVEPRLWVQPHARVVGAGNAEKTSEKTSEKALLPLDGLVIESAVGKWLGKISKWDAHLESMKEAGYNMIHFVPLQVRGGSNSPYSIHDQTAFSDDLFDESQIKLSREEKSELVKKQLLRIQDQYDMMCLSDVVWNHTSFDSIWLQDHPESGYNLDNSPHLVAAFDLDTALLDLVNDFPKYSLPTVLQSSKDLDAVMDVIKNNVFPDLKLWEYKVIDVTAEKKKLVEALSGTKKPDSVYNAFENTKIANLSLRERAVLLADHGIGCSQSGQRYGTTVELAVAVAFIKNLAGVALDAEVSESEAQNLAEEYSKVLDEYNLPLYKEYDEDVRVALENTRNRIEYTRLADHGPKWGEVTKSKPLVDAYFTRLPVNEKTKGHSKGSMALANNGWIWNADPMQDFAGPQSSAYLRREVICWGDCVKLRYGSGPEDSPYLWQHMKEYTEHTAKLFQGIRIDNCHSTPIHVAEYLLDAARRIQPDLYVVAELFTGSEDTDITFVSKLGINSLIREAMQAWDAAELSRLVHRHGGKPIGSMDQALTTEQTTYTRDGKTEEPAVLVPILHGSTPHALFMDCTHDNETPNEKRQAKDTLPNAALVAFSGSAIGSVKGYDEVYPRLLDIVNETRLYEQPKKDANVGITKVKPILQKLHTEMVLDGYIECHVHHEGDYIIVHRQHPELHTGYLLIAHTAFAGRDSKRGNVAPVKLRGTDVDLLFSATLNVDSQDDRSDETTLRGLSSKIESLSAPNIRGLTDNKGRYTEIVVPNVFPSGSVMVLKTWIQDNPAESYDLISSCSDNIFSNLSLLDMNIVLDRCEGEERDATGEGVYNIPGHGTLPYAGLEGFVSVLKPIIRENNLGHPFCAHLRDGTWAMDYIVDRLNRYLGEYPNLKPLREWFSTRFSVVKGLPDFLVPKYFALIIRTAYLKARSHALSLMSPLVRDGDRFTQSLALCSVQMYGVVPSSGLHPTEVTPSMAAGLPHFTHSYMRTWGRDVFISLRGLFLTTGNYDAAKRHILSFASSLKHGLIPNLLDAVRHPRYNSRDSVWWFMQAIQDYYYMAPDGPSILNEKVLRRFPKDDTFVKPEDGFTYSSTVVEIMHEVFERHAGGLHFREHNAGSQLDSQMTDEGFNIDIEVDWETGVIVGGNRLNCGTWQDKMGESSKAGNKGLPATPRDGAPIEITGLSKSALRWILELQERGEFKWTGVKDRDGKERTYKEWNDLLQKNFERVYYVPVDKSEDSDYEVLSEIINRRGIYKDVFRSKEPYTDYQFRSNFPVAMVVAPELFTPSKAMGALDLGRKHLLGPLGMRTLDPSDNEYHPDYHNSDDSTNKAVAKGWNYHQGPEWVWQTGYFLRAYLSFYLQTEKKEESLREGVLTIQRILLAHKNEIQSNPWAGLPELTNRNGNPCWDACPTQAWSAATLLDVVNYTTDLVKES
ncbi:hypothetical protein INT44_001801 [Umbelopsis vinacea]|uniref:Glycogen debranching enzyme n=1 Tax=Umbelopsis vinacea TaxID=44442 RepID=A0A8H7PRN2_9FUNG|nr:hypothetical protein INT44_001801 [Umbelopsis vinacea]